MRDKDIRKTWFLSLLVMGIVLLVGSLVVWLIPTVVLGGIDEKVNSRELHGPLTETKQKMLTDLQWSETWWKTKQITAFVPTSLILLIFGIVLIACALVVKFT